jgi:hypothetical protein
MVATFFGGFSMMMPISGNVNAYEQPLVVPSINHVTAFPSANNGSQEYDSGPLISGYGQQILHDGVTWLDLYTRWNPALVTVITSDYNNPAYPVGPFDDWNVTGTHAPNNATITKVYVVAEFLGWDNYPPPEGTYPFLSYSVSVYPPEFNHILSQDSVIPLRLLVFNRTYANPITCLAANITSFETWTPTMLKSSTLSALFRMNLPAQTTYQMDYLGFYYEWKYNETGGGGGDVGPIGYGSLQMPSPLGLFGIIGFVGMIAAPAAGIWFARRTDGSRLMLGLQVMIAFVVFLGLFFASIL